MQKTFGSSGDGNGPCSPPVSEKTCLFSTTRLKFPFKYGSRLTSLDLCLIPARSKIVGKI